MRPSTSELVLADRGHPQDPRRVARRSQPRWQPRQYRSSSRPADPVKTGLVASINRPVTEHRRSRRVLLSTVRRFAARSITEMNMDSRLLAIASAIVLTMANTAGWAASSTVKKTPGHIMQTTPQARSTGPGASEYAPGHLKRKSGSESASGFTPSHRTTGMRTR
jgi:hypothetical protein